MEKLECKMDERELSSSLETRCGEIEETLAATAAQCQTASVVERGTPNTQTVKEFDSQGSMNPSGKSMMAAVRTA